MRITLNLASRPFADLAPALKRLRIAMAALALVCILLGIGLHLFDSQAAAARAREHSLDGQIASVESERQQAEVTMHQPANAQVLTQAEALNQLFDEKAFSWTLAMEAMETVLPGGVQVTSIEPIRAKDGHITVHLRVVGPRDRTVDLVSNLDAPAVSFSLASSVKARNPPAAPRSGRSPLVPPIVLNSTCSPITIRLHPKSARLLKAR